LTATPTHSLNSYHGGCSMSNTISNIGRMSIIDESTAHKYINAPEGMTKGYEGRNWEKYAYGSVPFCAPRTRKVYDRAEWPERLRDREANGSRLKDLAKYVGIKTKNQQQTNFCWFNAPIQGLQLKRAWLNLPYVSLSPASGACHVTNYRNVGGYGLQALEWLKSHGAVPSELWPDNAIDPRYDTPKAREAAMLYRFMDWEDLRPRSFDELFSALLDYDPTIVGHNWWGHEVLHTDPVQIGRNTFGTIFWNSWGEDFEDGGFAVMSEDKATPDDAQSLRNVYASVPKSN